MSDQGAPSASTGAAATSRYIQTIKKHKEVREIHTSAALDNIEMKRIERENRERAGAGAALVQNEERFITSAYKQQLELRRKLEEKEAANTKAMGPKGTAKGNFLGLVFGRGTGKVDGGEKGTNDPSDRPLVSDEGLKEVVKSPKNTREFRRSRSRSRSGQRREREGRRKERGGERSYREKERSPSPAPRDQESRTFFNNIKEQSDNQKQISQAPAEIDHPKETMSRADKLKML